MATTVFIDKNSLGAEVDQLHALKSCHITGGFSCEPVPLDTSPTRETKGGGRLMENLL
jgi:hypothetical protein